MIAYSVACRNDACLYGGGRWADEPNPPCPACGAPTHRTSTVTVIDLGRRAA